jgi:transcription-repair coupling factor (superfamily II helicase)
VGLPAYDRASPALDQRAAAGGPAKVAAQARWRPHLLVTTINAVLQRTLTPFRIRESTRLLSPGVEIGRESLIALLQRQGYSRTDTVVDAGEYAVRGSVFDIYPTGLDHGLRLDFFGDELETLRLFDPNTQRSVQPVETHLLLPASEALLDEASIKRFRSRYRERFGANATSDPLYQAVSEGRRLAGMEHWLPLLEERMVTLFDHLGEGDLVVLDAAAAKAAESRLDDIADYYAARTEAPPASRAPIARCPPDALYLSREELDRALAGWPATAPPCLPSRKAPAWSTALPVRAISPPIARRASISTKRRQHLAALGTRGLKPIVAAYTTGSRARLASLAEASRPLPLRTPGRKRWAWPHRAARSRWSAARTRLCQRQPRTADRAGHPGRPPGAPQEEAQGRRRFPGRTPALTPGDLVVHMDHGIGRYEGSKRSPWARARTIA